MFTSKVESDKMQHNHRSDIPLSLPYSLDQSNPQILPLKGGNYFLKNYEL